MLPLTNKCLEERNELLSYLEKIHNASQVSSSTMQMATLTPYMINTGLNIYRLSALGDSDSDIPFYDGYYILPPLRPGERIQNEWALLTHPCMFTHLVWVDQASKVYAFYIFGGDLPKLTVMPGAPSQFELLYPIRAGYIQPPSNDCFKDKSR